MASARIWATAASKAKADFLQRLFLVKKDEEKRDKEALLAG